MKIVLLTWLCGPWAHVANWMVLGSFTPRPLLWDSDLSSIRVKWFLKSNFRFSKTLSRRAPSVQMIAGCTRRFRSYSPKLFWDFVSVAFAIPYHRNIPMDKYIHLTFILSSPVALVITRCPEILFDIPRILTLTALQFLAAWIPLRIITRAWRVSAHPQLFLCFTKVFKIIFDLPKILWSHWLLKFLLACIMVNPISLVVLMTFLVIIILSLLTQYVANTRNHLWSL